MIFCKLIYSIKGKDCEIFGESVGYHFFIGTRKHLHQLFRKMTNNIWRLLSFIICCFSLVIKKTAYIWPRRKSSSIKTAHISSSIQLQWLKVIKWILNWYLIDHNLLIWPLTMFSPTCKIDLLKKFHIEWDHLDNRKKFEKHWQDGIELYITQGSSIVHSK